MNKAINQAPRLLQLLNGSQNESEVECPRCDGAGKVSLGDGWSLCPKCRGKKVINSTGTSESVEALVNSLIESDLENTDEDPKVHEIIPDASANPALRKQMGTLRGGMVQAANSNPLPERFKVEPVLGAPRMDITDTQTGRKTTVPIFAYGEVRRALNELFSDE
jgi:hypothetical protein